MSITVTKSYTDSTTNPLTEAQLDDIKDSIETYCNTTNVPTADIQDGGIIAGLVQTGAVTTARISDSTVTIAKLADAVANAAIPTGSMLMYGSGGSAPSGFLLMNGQEVSQTTYADLFGVIGTLGGPAVSGTNFRIPDMRYRAVRGVDSLQANDPDAGTRTSDYTLIGGTAMQSGAEGDNPGSMQPFAIQGHEHPGPGRLDSSSGTDSNVFNNTRFADTKISTVIDITVVGTHTEGELTKNDFPVPSVATNFTTTPHAVVGFIIKT